jgi:hypothetical protein
MVAVIMLILETVAPPTAVNVETEGAKHTRLESAEVASKKYLAKFTMPCPQCGIAISKISDCNHMTCKFPLVRKFMHWLATVLINLI